MLSISLTWFNLILFHKLTILHFFGLFWVLYLAGKQAYKFELPKK